MELDLNLVKQRIFVSIIPGVLSQYYSRQQPLHVCVHVDTTHTNQTPNTLLLLNVQRNPRQLEESTIVHRRSGTQVAADQIRPSNHRDLNFRKKCHCVCLLLGIYIVVFQRHLVISKVTNMPHIRHMVSVSCSKNLQNQGREQQEFEQLVLVPSFLNSHLSSPRGAWILTQAQDSCYHHTSPLERYCPLWTRMLFPKAVLQTARVRILEQACWKCRFLGSTPGLLNLSNYRGVLESGCLIYKQNFQNHKYSQKI